MLLSQIIRSWAFVVSAQGAFVSYTEIWRMLWQTGIRVGDVGDVGDWLYIDGGGAYFASNPSLPVILNQTFWIGLSKSWTKSSVMINTIEKPKSYVAIRRPSLWFHSTTNEIYSFGGEPCQVGTELSVWALSPNGRGGGTWNERFPPKSNIFTALTHPAYGLDTTSSTRGYILGGIATECTSPQFAFLDGSLLSLSGMAGFDFKDQSWTNISYSGYSQKGWGVYGAAHFVKSFGDDGVLVLFGGDAPLGQ